MIPTIIALMQAHAGLTAITTPARIYGRPLRKLREGLLPEADPLATPEAFTTTSPSLLRPSVVVSPVIPRQDHGGNMPAGWAVDYLISVAYYAPPGGEGTLRAMAVQGSAAINRKRVPVPQGGTGLVRIAHLTVGPDVVPEFPNSGVVMIDTFRVASVWRVP